VAPVLQALLLLLLPGAAAAAAAAAPPPLGYPPPPLLLRPTPAAALLLLLLALLQEVGWMRGRAWARAAAGLLLPTKGPSTSAAASMCISKIVPFVGGDGALGVVGLACGQVWWASWANKPTTCCCCEW
jgi:hypothetical protein